MFLPPFWKTWCMPLHYQIAGSQTNRQRQHDHRILQKRLSEDLFPNRLQTKKSRKQENIRKTSDWVEASAIAQSPF